MSVHPDFERKMTWDALTATLRALFPGGPTDAERANKRAIYDFAAAQLAQATGRDEATAAAWLKARLGEGDLDEPDLPAPRPPSPQASASFETTLHSLEVSYRPADPTRTCGDWDRAITVTLRPSHGEQGLRRRVVDALDWSELPSDVRKAALSERAPSVDFQLITPSNPR